MHHALRHASGVLVRLLEGKWEAQHQLDSGCFRSQSRTDRENHRRERTESVGVAEQQCGQLRRRGCREQEAAAACRGFSDMRVFKADTEGCFFVQCQTHAKVEAPRVSRVYSSSPATNIPVDVLHKIDPAKEDCRVARVNE